MQQDYETLSMESGFWVPGSSFFTNKFPPNIMAVNSLFGLKFEVSYRVSVSGIVCQILASKLSVAVFLFIDIK